MYCENANIEIRASSYYTTYLVNAAPADGTRLLLGQNQLDQDAPSNWSRTFPGSALRTDRFRNGVGNRPKIESILGRPR